MKEAIYNRETLLEILHSKEATVKFCKLNGDLRIMRCTLKFDLFPEKVQSKLLAEETDVEQNSNDTITVFDLDEQDWRSFRIDRIIEVA